MIISVSVKFDAAHRLIAYEGKCKNLHGHTYEAIVEVESAISIPEMNSKENKGMVVDFGTLKSAVKRWIDNHWDHNVILHDSDLLLKNIAALKPDDSYKEPYRMFVNPTAENMTVELFNRLKDHFELVGSIQDESFVSVFRNIRLKSVKILETGSTCAQFDIHDVCKEK